MSIKSLISEKESKGWTITFMGTSQEAMFAAEQIGIKQERVLCYNNSKKGTAYAFNKMSSARRKYQDAVVMDQAVEDIFDVEDKRG